MRSCLIALILGLILIGCGRNTAQDPAQKPIPDPAPTRGTVQLDATVVSCDEGICELTVEGVAAYGAAVPQLVTGSALSVIRLDEALSDIRQGMSIRTTLALKRRPSEEGEMIFWEVITAASRD